MTYDQFENSIFEDIVPNRDPYLRAGQSIMNYLYHVWPAEYDRIVKDEVKGWHDSYDCFYVDRRISALLKHLKERWDKYPN